MIRFTCLAALPVILTLGCGGTPAIPTGKEAEEMQKVAEKKANDEERDELKRRKSQSGKPQ